MKKHILITLLSFACFAVFAQSTASTDDLVNSILEVEDPDDKKVQVITPENIHPEMHRSDKTGNVIPAEVKIEYIPYTDEARIYYTCMSQLFVQDHAMSTIKACLDDFMKEKHYTAYKYLSKDRTKYFKNDRGMQMATYSSYVKFASSGLPVKNENAQNNSQNAQSSQQQAEQAEPSQAQQPQQ